ncbi:hypothetical protein ACWD7C_13780 [Streptomyces sp. NPDC005134]|uniref:hypothetical protein n=1 Tax=unclassified Streptomyces TaxID=2593676 RepID=UPI0033A5C98E
MPRADSLGQLRRGAGCGSDRGHGSPGAAERAGLVRRDRRFGDVLDVVEELRTQAFG